jgi:polyhydroxyalkanoate synthesis regulator phasin
MEKNGGSTMNTSSIPSIGSSAMLTTYKASVYTGRKLDKRASQEVEYRNNATPQMANVHKKLLGNCEELTAIQKHVANTRNAHSFATLAWEDNGARLITTAAYFEYTKMMSGAEQVFWKLVDDLVAVYDNATQEARQHLGDLFNEADYPNVEELRRKFGWSLTIAPIPQSGDFRLDIQNDAMEELKLQYEQSLEAKINGSMNDVWTRLHEALDSMSTRIDYGDHEQKKIFRDTLVTNLTDVLDMLDTFNVTNDPKMREMKAQLEDTLSGVTPDALREDGHLRAQTKRDIDEAIKQLPTLGW